MNNAISQDAVSRHRELIRIAYRLWHEAGRPQGPYSRFWAEAERQLQSQATQQQKASSELFWLETRPLGIRP
jgi:hypothetical protein